MARTKRTESLNIRVLPELKTTLLLLKKLPSTKWHRTEFVSDSDIIHQALYDYAKTRITTVPDIYTVNALNQYMYEIEPEKNITD